MANTRNYRYPTKDDDPNVPVWMDRLAEDVAGDIDANLVKYDDPGVPREVAPAAEWVEVTTDRTGRVSRGTRATGETYIGLADLGTATVGLADIAHPILAGADVEETTDTGYPFPVVDSAGRIAEPFAFGPDGRMKQWVLDAWAARMSIGAGTGTPLAPLNKVACFGDSMTEIDRAGVSYPSVLAAQLGVEVHNGGGSGNTSSQVAMRQGGLDVWLTVAGGSIPASGAVNVTVLPTGSWRNWYFYGTLAGVHGTLYCQPDLTWTFTRSVAGTAVAVPTETRWVSEQSIYQDWVQVFWTGRNIPNVDLVARDTKAMAQGLRPAVRKYLVISTMNTTAEPSGSAGYDLIMAINAQLAKDHGHHFYDLRGYIIRNGLADAGITPTAADTTAIAEDRLPPSLLQDTTHFNEAGRTVAGRRIAAVLKQKGYIV